MVAILRLLFLLFALSPTVTKGTAATPDYPVSGYEIYPTQISGCDLDAPAAVTVEEAGATVEMQGLFSLLNVVQVGQVHLFYRARLLNTQFDPGIETIEARLFHEHEIPWDQLAFRTVRETLKRYFEDSRSGQFGLHVSDIR